MVTAFRQKCRVLLAILLISFFTNFPYSMSNNFGLTLCNPYIWVAYNSAYGKSKFMKIKHEFSDLLA